MFKILGADGREYGPVAVDQVKKWIAEGRANRETMVQQAGDMNWKPLGQFAEFSDVLGPVPPPVSGTPPPATAAPVSPAAPVGSSPVGADARARARQCIAGPAIALMVMAGLGIAGSLFGLAMTLARRGAMPEMPGMDPGIARIVRMLASGPFAIASNFIGIAIGALILFGALQMQKLTNRGFAVAVAIIAMIPCLSPCCVLGLPFGIWALVVLSKPEVKSQFS